jgi:iron complex outermembrane recepter protein
MFPSITLSSIVYASIKTASANLRRGSFVFFFLVSLLGSLPAFAQSAAVTGEVADPSGAVLPKAKVSLTNSKTNTVQRTTTNSAGAYSLQSVPAGTYKLAVEAAGFKRYEQTAVVVPAGQSVTLNVKLSVGAVTESVTVDVSADHPLLEMPSVGKTGTKIEELPSSVQVISHELVESQGGLDLKDAIRNSSGVFQGGSDGFGFADRFLVRGLDARIYNDGFSDGDQRNGIPHSLNGVENVEILEGPGSALFGSGPPGGTINMVHFLPSDTLNYGGAFETGSFGEVSGNLFVTGSTGIHGLNYRVDGLAQRADGFRSLGSSDYEIRPEIGGTFGKHALLFSVDARDLHATPDPAGLVYVNGAPITGVSRETKYSTPFSIGDQSLVRTNFSDAWSLAPYVTITNRFSYMYRDLSILRNGDGGTITGIVLSGRQLRRQHDNINDFDYEFEPVWNFKTGRIRHTLLTGFEAQHQGLHTNRDTADLPSITNIFNPVIQETSVGGLTFLRDAKHSGDIDDLAANYYGMYAADQIDLTSRLKVRLSARQDWWNTSLNPEIFVPGRIFQGTQLIEPGTNFGRSDQPLNWSAGAIYRLFSRVSPFFGVARSNLATFSSESTQNGVHDPESGLQYEAGVKAATFNDRATFTVAGFDVKRNNVFSLVGDTPVFNDQRTRGVEADVQLILWSKWHVSANGIGQQAVLTDNPSNPAAAGKSPIGVPRYMFNLWTAYNLKIANLSGLTIGGGLTYRDSMFGDLLNTKGVPSFTTFDTVLSYAARRWDFSLGLRNLTDTTYFVAANGVGAFVGEPRSVFVKVKRSFGPKQ